MTATRTSACSATKADEPQRRRPGRPGVQGPQVRRHGRERRTAPAPQHRTRHAQDHRDGDRTRRGHRRHPQDAGAAGGDGDEQDAGATGGDGDEQDAADHGAGRGLHGEGRGGAGGRQSAAHEEAQADRGGADARGQRLAGGGRGELRGHQRARGQAPPHRALLGQCRADPGRAGGQGARQQPALIGHGQPDGARAQHRPVPVDGIADGHHHGGGESGASRRAGGRPRG
ncbi:hypothetical protein [Streptomyces sp. MAI_2237]